MNTKIIVSTFLSVAFVAMAVVAPQAEAAQAYAYAQGQGHAYAYAGGQQANAYGYYLFPGNSLYGRMHNPNFYYKWGNRSFGSIEEAIEYARNNFYTPIYSKKITWIDTDKKYTRSSGEVDVTTRSATNVDEDSATLRGTADLDGEKDALVWFEYGTRSSNLSDRTSKKRIDEDDNEDFSRTISNLDDNTRYYFRAVIENDGDREHGSIMSFYTDDDRDSDEDYPEAYTDSANNVDDDSADIRGSVDMNDFNNGIVFFVYGEDRRMIEDVDKYSTYRAIKEDNENLVKFRVDSDLDTSGAYIGRLRGLDDDTTYYYRIGVEFEDEDDDDRLELGSVRSFRTDD